MDFEVKDITFFEIQQKMFCFQTKTNQLRNKYNWNQMAKPKSVGQNHSDFYFLDKIFTQLLKGQYVNLKINFSWNSIAQKMNEIFDKILP